MGIHPLKPRSVHLMSRGQTTASVNTFIMTMMIYPEIQKKAQAELDALLNGERLPTLDDRDALPYLTAILKEVLRSVSCCVLGNLLI